MMKLSRRKFLHSAAGAAVVPAAPHRAMALDYPTRPVHLIIGYPPGGSADMTARLTGQWLSERLGQQFIVESRPGAATNLATESVVRAAPDGYTLLLAAPANATNVALFAQLNFDFMRDIVPVAGIIRFPDVVEVNQSVPVHTIPELIAYAKANPRRSVPRCCQICRPWLISCRAMRQAPGTVSARRKARPLRSSIRSTRRSMQCWPTRKRERDLPNSGRRCFRVQLPTSVS